MHNPSATTVTCGYGVRIRPNTLCSSTLLFFRSFVLSTLIYMLSQHRILNVSYLDVQEAIPCAFVRIFSTFISRAPTYVTLSVSSNIRHIISELSVSWSWLIYSTQSEIGPYCIHNLHCKPKNKLLTGLNSNSRK